MATISKADFLTHLRVSEVLEEKKLTAWLADNDSENPKTIALALVKAKMLTRWQAKYLLSGRSKLHLGNYRLLERISRTNLGDRFLAIHLQLDRNVEIQVLPTELVKSQMLRDQFLEKAALAAKLDHPNLFHVYDIDQEGGRLILVSEHLEGKRLSEIPADSLTDLRIAEIVHQSLAGIKHAYQHDVVHGEVSAENIWLTKSGVVKIKDIALARLEKQLVGGTMVNKLDPDQDIAAAASAGIGLLNNVSVASDDRGSLLALLETTEAEPSIESLSLSMEALEDWISENKEVTLLPDESVVPLAAEPLEVEPLAEALPLSEALPLGQAPPLGELPTSPVVKPPSRPKPTPAANTEPNAAPPVKKKGGLGTWMAKNPVAVIGTAAAIAFLVLGGTIMLAYNLVSQPTTKPVAKNTPVKKTKTAQSQPGNDDTGEDTPEIKPEEKPEEKPPEIKRGGSAYGTKVDQEAVKKQLQLIGGGTNPATTNSPETLENNEPAGNTAAPMNPPEAQPKPAENTPPTAEDSPPNADETEPKKVEPEKVEPAKKEPPATQPKEQPKAQPKAQPKEQAKEKPKGNPDKPFEKLAAATQLPESASTKVHSIGKVFIPSTTLLGCELVSTVGISKSKNFFEMKRSPNDKQTWMIGWKKKESDSATEVAQVQRKDTELSFQWLPAAAENENANYLRNCKLKLFANNRKHWVSLREPVVLSGLNLTADHHQIEIETELAWLPHPKNTAIIVPSFRAEGDVVVVDPERISKKPARVFFSNQDEEKFLWLEVKADAKKNLKLEVALKMLVNGRAKVCKPAMLDDLVGFTQTAWNQSLSNRAALEGQKKPQNYKGDFMADLRKAKERGDRDIRITKAAYETAVRYDRIVRKLYKAGTPLEVKFMIGPGDELMLAKSDFNDQEIGKRVEKK